MNILVTLDRNYLEPLRVMLGSMFMNHPHDSFDIYMISEGLTIQDMNELTSFCHIHRSRLHPVKMNEAIFQNAPSKRYYSKSMYYRLLAAELLPGDLDKILYLDPDILIINHLSELYHLDLDDKLFAAASHTDNLGFSDMVNRLRLENYDAERYYNSGVLLMNLYRMREEVRKQTIFDYIEKNGKRLVLPDQDVLNALYGHQIVEVDETLWNFDSRHFERYYLQSKGLKDIDWIVENTAILHFCGKKKPWKKDYMDQFSLLYKHYQVLTRKMRSTF